MANSRLDASDREQLRYLYNCSQSALVSTPYHRRFFHKLLLDFQALRIDRQDLGFHCQDHIFSGAGFPCRGRHVRVHLPPSFNQRHGRTDLFVQMSWCLRADTGTSEC